LLFIKAWYTILLLVVVSYPVNLDHVGGSLFQAETDDDDDEVVGLGDLFVIRVAGNIVAPSLIGSIELAAEKFGPRLVVVLGHTGCGAVDVTINTMQDLENASSDHVNDIVERIRPAVSSVLAGNDAIDRDALMRDSVRANVRASVDALRHGSETLERLIRDDGLMVVGAEYSLETGLVQFFDGVVL